MPILVKCARCGKEFRARGSTRYCPPGCLGSAMHQRSRDHHRKTHEPTGKWLGRRYDPRSCAQCGRRYVPRSPNQAYCSPDCSGAHHRNACRDRMAAMRARRKANGGASH